MELFYYGGHTDTGNHDIASDYENDRRSFESCAGFFFREGSFGLGAGKLRTVFRIVLPSAVPGILAGVILGVGRIVGETAALIYTAGTVTGVASGLFSSGRTLSVHMYALLSEGLYTNQAYATAVVLLIVVIIINAISGLIARKVTKR